MYIGLTYDLKRRKRHHSTHSDRHNQELNNWLNSLKDQNSIPLMEVLKECPDFDNGKKWESIFIKQLRPILFNIKN